MCPISGLTMRPEGDLLASIAGDPFIAVRTFGEGRTAAFASDAAPRRGPAEFVDRKHYGDFWANLFGRLTERQAEARRK